MSYDVSIANINLNYTSNGGKLFHDHMPSQENDANEHNGMVTSRPSGLQGLDSLKGREAVAIIYKAMQSMNNERRELGKDGEVGESAMTAKYDSPNGWGSLVGQLLFLGSIAAACGMHPNKVVHVN